MDIDYFVTEVVLRANSLMVVTEKVNSQPKKKEVMALLCMEVEYVGDYYLT